MSLKSDLKFCKKINRLKDFLISPSGFFLLITLLILINIARTKKP